MPTLPDEPPASASAEAVRPEHAADFLRLQALWSKGQRFGLLLAAVDNPDYAAALRHHLDAQRLGHLLTVGIEDSPLDVLAALQAHTPAQAGAVHLVFALNAPRSERWWQHANVLRERWAEAWPGPLLLWLSSLDLDLVAHQAPDLWNWRDGVFGFTATAVLSMMDALALRLGADDEWMAVLDQRSDASPLARLEGMRQLRSDAELDALTSAYIDLEKANILKRMGDWSLARQTADVSRQAFERLDRPSEAGKSKLVLADLLKLEGKLEEALRLLTEEIRPLYVRLGDVRTEALVMGEIAEIRTSQGDFDQALDELSPAIEIFRRIGDLRSLAISLGKFAAIQLAKGALDAALSALEESMTLIRPLGDLSLEATLMSKLGDAHLAHGQVQLALNVYLKEVIPRFTELEDLRSLAYTNIQVAGILSIQGRLTEALELLRTGSLPALHGLGDLRSIGVANGQVADVLAKLGRYDEALETLEREVLPVFRNGHEPRALTMIQVRLAAVLAVRGRAEDLPRIEDLLRQAHTSAIRMNLPQTGQIEELFQQLFGRPLPPAA